MGDLVTAFSIGPKHENLETVKMSSMALLGQSGPEVHLHYDPQAFLISEGVLLMILD